MRAKKMKKLNSLAKKSTILIMVLSVLISLSGCSSPDNKTELQTPATEESNYPKVDISTEAPSIDNTEVENKDEAKTSVSDTTITENVAQEIDEEVLLTPTQLNTVNMLNYMTALTQNVTEERKSQLFLEKAYNSFDNLYPNSVDIKTQSQITNLMDTINDYRMISVKRDRLEFIYENNKAQALRQAIPNPIALLSAVQSGSPMKIAASVLYMAVDSVSSYQSASSQADMQFIKDGWQLDDAESDALHISTKNALTYMFEMVRTYDLPGDYALSRSSVEDFITWSNRPDSQLVNKIAWFESHQNMYKKFGPYWLALAKCYYNSGEYAKCLQSISEYERITTRIFRQNLDYAEVLPMVIVSAKETMNKEDYIKTAGKYCQLILSNSKDSNWSIRYFTAQIYIDLYAQTNNSAYLDNAYNIIFNNVNELVSAQRELNASYLLPVKETKAEKDATKREKDEINQYNKIIKEERKTALPPVNEALYLNCDLLFSLAEKRDIDTDEKVRIESIIHENGNKIFLSDALDQKFWFNSKNEIDQDSISVDFDGKKFIIPVSYVTDRSLITVTVSDDSKNNIFEDWHIVNVDRPKDGSLSEFKVAYESDGAKTYKYTPGELVTIKVIPLAENPDKYLEFQYDVIAVKNLYLFDGIKFERKNR